MPVYRHAYRVKQRIRYSAGTDGTYDDMKPVIPVVWVKLSKYRYRIRSLTNLGAKNNSLDPATNKCPGLVLALMARLSSVLERCQEQVVRGLQVIQQLADLIVRQLKGGGLLVQPLVRLPHLVLKYRKKCSVALSGSSSPICGMQ